jgi:type III secretion protein X
MTDLYPNAITLERGIEGVSHLRRDTEERDFWPEHQSLPPPSQAVKAQLSELLNSPDMTWYLSSALQPTVSKPELLTPARFHATLSTALQQIRAETRINSEDAKLLARAVRLLTEEIGLRELAQMYRSSLYQG